MGWKAPGSIRFKHMVLQHKVFGVGPVVGNFVIVMIPHDIGLSIAAACWIIRVYATPQSMFGLSDEPIHLPMIDVSTRVCCTMRPPMIEVLWVMIRLHALARQGIGHTHGGNTVGHW